MNTSTKKQKPVYSATFNKVLSFNPSDKFKSSHRKENYFWKSLILVAYHKKEVKNVCEIRFYHTNIMCYACFWFHFDGVYSSGSGSAGGYGYDKKSTAAAEAMEKAGFKFAASFAATGCEEEALKAIARHFNLKKFQVISAHA